MGQAVTIAARPQTLVATDLSICRPDSSHLTLDLLPWDELSFLFGLYAEIPALLEDLSTSYMYSLTPRLGKRTLERAKYILDIPAAAAAATSHH